MKINSYEIGVFPCPNLREPGFVLIETEAYLPCFTLSVVPVTDVEELNDLCELELFEELTEQQVNIINELSNRIINIEKTF